MVFNIMIAGCGRVGSHLAQLFSLQGHNVTVIDKEESSFSRLGSTFNGLTARGVAFDEELLRRSGIETADIFISVTNFDNTNLMAAQVASKIYGVPRVMARLYNPDKEVAFRRLGVDYICGTTLVAERTMARLTERYQVHLDRPDKDLQVFEGELGRAGHGLSPAELESPGEVRILSVLRRGEPLAIADDMALEAGDTLVAAASAPGASFLSGFMHERLASRFDKREALKVVIAGCGRVGAQLAEMLSLDGYRVVVLDHDTSSFRRLSKSYRGEVVTGIAFDEEALGRAGIETADAFAAVTNYDNTNLMAAEVAQQVFSVPRVVARLFNPDKEVTFEALRVPYVSGTVCMAEAFAERLIDYPLLVRSRYHSNRFALVEFDLPVKWGDRPLLEMERREGLRFAALLRGEQRIVPNGSTTLKRGDRAVAAMRAGRAKRLARQLG